MKGILSEGALPALLRAVYVGRKTGILHFRRGADVRSVRFRQGHILSAQSTVANEHLGEVLVRNELLTQADLDRAGARKRATGKKLGETLQEMGLIDPEHLEDALALHVREVLLAVFSWNDGDYELEEPSTLSFDGEPTLKLSTGEMILETVRLLQNHEVVRAALGNTDRVLDQSTDPLLRFQKVTLSPTDGYVLSRVDGILKAREILEMIPLPQEEVEKSLYGLLCTGIIEFAAVSARRPASSPPALAGAPPRAAAPAPATAAGTEARAKEDAKKKEEDARRQEVEARRKQILAMFEGLPTKNHFEVLGIPRASGEAQVKEAYFQLARKYHPDTHHDPAMDDLGEKLEAVFIRLGQAYEVLRNPRTRASYESDLAARAPRGPRPAAGGPVVIQGPSSPGHGNAPGPAAGPAPPPPAADHAQEARRAFESMIQAERHIENEKYWDAIQLLEAAVHALEGKNLGRARLALGRAYSKNPKWTKQAEAALKGAVEADGKNAGAHVELGGLYARQGLRSRAVSAYRKALDLQPDRQDAAAGLAALGPDDEPPPEEKGGLLKKLFGKR
jgi:tetratricopeptide (TPR) repeat protein